MTQSDRDALQRAGSEVREAGDVVADATGPLSASMIAGLLCRCPRCGKGRLFDGYLTLRRQCPSCDLDFSFADAADGPAIFVIFFSGFIVAGSALAVEFIYAPSYWVHAALWGPLILVTTLAPLRSVKGLMVALQYHHRAAEGRFSAGDSQ